MFDRPLETLNAAALLRQHGLRPNKRLGQNFLVDEAALAKIVEISAVTSQETVLEIGAGLGGLTRHLASRAHQVVAVELDGRLLPILQRVLSPFPNVRLVQGDILKLDPADLLEVAGYLVVANIPYYITSALIRHLLEARHKPSRLVLTLQKEVAERICARPGALSLLGLSVQVYGRPQIRAHIPAGAFYPAPQVDSAVVRVDLYPQPLIPYAWLETFFRLARAAFAQKRKNLRNALAAGMGWSPPQAERLLLQAGIDPRRRAETVSLDEWKALVQTLLETPGEL